jgi:type IV pilus assembly protein PilQ
MRAMVLGLLIIGLGDSPESAMAAEEAVRSERRIDLDMRQANVRNVLRLIAKAGEVALEMDADVEGAVTIHARSIPWKRALAAVARESKLSYELDGDVLRVRRAAR